MLSQGKGWTLLSQGEGWHSMLPLVPEAVRGMERMAVTTSVATVHFVTHVKHWIKGDGMTSARQTSVILQYALSA